MTNTLQKSLETLMQAQLEPIIQLKLLRGFEVIIRRPNKQNSANKVFGDFAGTAPGDYTEFTTLAVFGDSYFETMGIAGVTHLDKISLFAKDELYAGDILIIDRDDGKEKSYKILPTEVAGSVLSIATRYTAVSIEL
jgi:hypothetical protein